MAKRMNQEEKRTVILNIYHATKDVFTEKEILSLASKAGVAQNSILEINEKLIDDNLVIKQKIGGSNYMFSFPDSSNREKLRNVNELESKLLTSKTRKAELDLQYANSKIGREDTPTTNRTLNLKNLDDLKNEIKTNTITLNKLKENDPQLIHDLQKQLQMTKESANRWTDNIYNCKSYLQKKRGMSSKEASKIIGIKDDFDYPDESLALKNATKAMKGEKGDVRGGKKKRIFDEDDGEGGDAKKGKRDEGGW